MARPVPFRSDIQRWVATLPTLRGILQDLPPQHCEDQLRLLDDLIRWQQAKERIAADDAGQRIGSRAFDRRFIAIVSCRPNLQSLCRTGDPFHLQKNVEVGGSQTPDCRVMLRTSPDEGRTFGPARQLTGEKRYIETASGRALRLKTGRILVECDTLETAFCLISDDDGASWREGQHVKPSGGGCWEPAAVERKDGRVLMFLRMGLGGQYQTISEDGGMTWGEATLTALRGTAAPISIERIPQTGDLLAVWNNDLGSPRARNPLTAAISRDDGKTWEHFRNLADATGDAFAYPSVTFVGDRALLTYFHYQGGISLLLQGIPVKWFYE